MEIGEDLKYAKVAVVPADWDVRELRGECELITKGTTPTSLGKSFTKEGVNFIKIETLEDDGRIIPEKIAFIDEETNRLLRRSQLRAGDILFSIAGALGRTTLIKDEILPANTNQALALIRLKPKSSLDHQFLIHYLASHVIKKHIEAINVQAAQANLSLENIGDFRVIIPPPHEQVAIVSALSDVDALLTALDALIAKKRLIKQGAMQELLTGKRRLPGFSDEWKSMALKDVAPLQRGFDLPTSQLEAGTYPVVYSNGILNFHTSYKVKAPGVVTGRSGTIGKVSYVDSDFWPHNTSLWVTDFKSNAPRFIYYLYASLKFERFGTGSGVPTLNRNDVHAFTICIPPTADEQTAIAEILSDMDAEIAALEARREKTRLLKQGMMQELLTGRIRLV